MNERDRLAALDGLRAVAIMGVLLVHSGIASLASASARPFIYSGARGVQLFFVISGFTLMHSWHRRASLDGRESPACFLLRRFFRIAPMYYVGIVATFMILGFSPRYWAPGGIGTGDIIANVLFIHSWFPNAMTSVVGGGWSIGDEMTFYLLVPLIVLVVRGLASALVLFGAAASLSALSEHFLNPVIIAQNPGSYVQTTFVLLWPPAQAPAFCAGIVGYLAWRSLPAQILNGRSACGLTIGSALLYVALVWHGYGLPHATLFGTVFVLLVVGVVVRPVGILVNPVTILIGRISFSMYVVHFIVLEIFVRSDVQTLRFSGVKIADLSATEGLSHFAVFVALVVAVSYLTYVGIERPAIRFGSSLIDRLRLRREKPAFG